MDFVKVEKVIREEKISNNAEFYPKKFELPGPRIIGLKWNPHLSMASGGPSKVGMCIGVNLGSSGFWKGALGYWGFDKERKLIDVFVYKQYNGLDNNFIKMLSRLAISAKAQ